MSDKNTAEEAIKGVVEDAKGKAKEAVGTVTGRDDLIREGKAQQDKAESERDAAKKEAEAEKSRAEAKVDEQRQKASQDPDS
ncbi:CsbD family protein [Mycobacterium sp. 1274756.6]|uniref:microaggregate-binding protein 1 n=1 Tax=Mycobacterium sp. 1274756.6 TaxID=1834076 RepID=UPI0007FEBFBF|nr:CsbD family protein [Mycobacterium sp. 1274756.6]OBJ71972.1 general stress protein CsbD [Mycobacterium sp. 1274756.6]